MNIERVSIYNLTGVFDDCIFQGNGQGWISSFSTVGDAEPESLVWVNPTRQDRSVLLESTKSNCVIVGYSDEYTPRQGQLLIKSGDPRLLYAKVLNQFLVSESEYGIHPTAIVSSKAVVAENVYIGPYTIVGECSIGAGCIISSNCKIGSGTRLGNGVKISAGVVIGSDGFGFVKDTNGQQLRFPHVGGVTIDDYVEIGANTCIDKGTIGNTVIKKYAKIDNLVHVAHNVEVGVGTMIAANAMIGGSTIVGDDVWIAPNAAIRDGLHLGNRCFIGLGAIVTKNVPCGEVWAGSPAKFIRAL